MSFIIPLYKLHSFFVFPACIVCFTNISLLPNFFSTFMLYTLYPCLSTLFCCLSYDLSFERNFPAFASSAGSLVHRSLSFSSQTHWRHPPLRFYIVYTCITKCIVPHSESTHSNVSDTSIPCNDSLLYVANSCYSQTSFPIISYYIFTVSSTGEIFGSKARGLRCRVDCIASFLMFSWSLVLKQLVQ